ncbi:MAG TPA: hypothetical protein VE175_07400, partial [Woeseiaceae bacterium]|nr:hypothetical protein [Woeseiaceae bacterium]
MQLQVQSCLAACQQPEIAETRLSDAIDGGITVSEISPMEQAIEPGPETTTAFIGRTLRGPINT